jgi:hypothetical protein
MEMVVVTDWPGLRVRELELAVTVKVGVMV